MLESVLAYLRNWFIVETYSGRYTISGGRIELPFLQNGQYFCIAGSVFNDGVHNYPTDNLSDEEFCGVVCAMAVPKSLLAVVKEIEDWQTKYKNRAESPYQSESYDGYTYTLKSGESATWQKAFSAKLSRWRKI